MDKKAVFQIEIKENGEIAFNKLTGGATQFEKQARKTQSASEDLNHVFNSMKSQLLGLAGVYASMQFFGGSETYYLSIRRAAAEIQASLKSTGEAAGVTQKQLDDSANQLYHTTTYNKENIMQMQAMLLTFPKILHGNFGEAQQAIVDMAAKFKETDLQGFAVRIGKALQDPATGMMMLRREGVNFTKEQTEMIKGMVQAGHLAKAQKYIMHELSVEFAGSAQAAFEAGGAHAHLGKIMEDFKEETGKFVAELETDFLPAITSVIKDFQEWIKWGEAHKGFIEGSIKVVGGLTVGILAYNVALKAAALSDFLFGTSLAAMTTGLGEAAIATEGETAAMTALDVAMDANPIGLVAAALVGLGIALKPVSDATITEDDNISKLSGHYKTLAENIRDATKAQLGYFQASNLGYTSASMDRILDIQEQKLAYDQFMKLSLKSAKKENILFEKLNHISIAEAFKQGNITYEPFAVKGTSHFSLKTPLDTSGKPGLAGTNESPASDVKETNKQIINTWNIKEFGKMTVFNGSTGEAKGDIYDHILEALTAAQRDSEIASTE